MNVLGLHLLVELKECNPSLLDDLNHIRLAMIRAAQEANAHIVGESFHHFSPQGVTGILAIAESHISIHTWPEYAYAGVDIFSCGRNVDVGKAISVLRDQLRAEEVLLVAELDRGTVDESGNMLQENPETLRTKPS